MLTATDVILDSIRVTVLMPRANYAERNPRLVSHWREVLGHDYQLPAPPPRPKTPLDGTSSETALHSLEQVATWERLKTMGTFLFRGGVGHCNPHPRGLYPIEAVNGFLHFYQNPLPWSRYSKAFVFRFLAGVLFKALTTAEVELYRFAVLPDRLVFRDFKALFDAYVMKAPALLESYHSRYGEIFTRQRLEVIEYVLQPETLKRRAPQVANYRFP